MNSDDRAFADGDNKNNFTVINAGKLAASL